MLEWLTPELDWYLMLRHLRDLVLAYLLAIPSAWDDAALSQAADELDQGTR
jgi:hypothetical protein